MFARASAVAALTLLAAHALAGTATITVDAAGPGKPINPRMYGIFLEEINLGIDGGLYPEMIRNRGFEDAKPPEGFERDANGRWKNHNPKKGDSGWDERANSGLPHWSLIKEGAAAGTMELDLANPLNPTNPRSLRLEIANPAGRLGVANEGFFGINAVAGEKYRLSFYARCEGFDGALTATLESKDGAACTTPVQISGLTGQWKQYQVELTATKTDHTARFVLAASSKGKIWLDLVSLFPAKTFKDRPNGLRPDIAQLLADLKPGFVRFPGGCVVEGGSIGNAYNWKKTVGPLEGREEIWGTWGFRRTHGMGFFEYFQFCQDIGADPLPVLFAGESCGFRDWELVPVEQNAWIIANYLDLVEYANGPADSAWGKLRAAAGHAAPFGLQMIEIGNENAGPAYNANYPLIYQALKSKHPEIRTIACFNNPGGGPTEMVDDHYYNNPFWFLNNTAHYDRRDRKLPPVYVGEYACNSEECGQNGNLFGALAEAAFALGMEKNGDTIRMCSYAPLLANMHAKNWGRNLINFDTWRVFGQPSYYAQKLLMNHCPDTTLPTEAEAKFDTAEKATAAFRLVAPGTQLQVKDLKIQQNGRDVVTADLSSPDFEKRGRWSTQEGALTCADGGDLIGKLPANLTDFTLTLKVRKTGGNPHEGLFLDFGRTASGGPLSWNLGNSDGKRSTLHGGGLEHPRDFTLELNRWYDLAITVTGGKITASIDGKVLHDTAVPPTARFFALAGKDQKTGDLILKAINTSGEKVTAAIDLRGLSTLPGQGATFTLQGESLTAENTLEDPLHVHDLTSPATGLAPKFTREFAPYSFTVLRIKTR